jgi:hypothetical protein
MRNFYHGVEGGVAQRTRRRKNSVKLRGGILKFLKKQPVKPSVGRAVQETAGLFINVGGHASVGSEYAYLHL